MAGHCQAPGCTETVLCEAHIIPRGFARTLSGPGGRNLAIKSSGAQAARQQHGEYDTGILCAACDAKLGMLDDYATSLCASLPSTPDARTGQIFEHSPFDGARFASAMLAIFWRASISRREQFRGIDIGPYRDRAAQILFADAPLSSLPEFELVLYRYASSHVDARKFIFMPLWIRAGQLNAYTVGLGGFLVWAKFDQRRVDRLIAPQVINAATSLRAHIIRFSETTEFDYFKKVAHVERRRTAG